MNVKEMTEEYISYRRSIGEKFVSQATMLRAFAKHVGEGEPAGSIDGDLCTSFLYGKDGKVTASWFLRYSALKWLFDWAVVRKYMQSVPLKMEKPKQLEHIRPYVYSREELKKLFDAAMSYQKNRSSTPPECVQMVLKVTYCLGLRIHETMSLKLADIDMAGLCVTIRDSKFHKTRIVPFNKPIADILHAFMEWRKLQGYSCLDDSPLFPDKRGRPLNVETMRQSFKRIRDCAGIRRDDGAIYQPRLHDLRHSFAVHRLTAWYREGKDVQKLVSHLSTYLGHDKVSHTSVYLSMTDSLLEEANKRFELYHNEGKT